MAHRSRLSLLLLMLNAGCPSKGGPATAIAGSGFEPKEWEVRSFSETVPFTSVTQLGGKLYAGTPAGAIRFDAQSGDFVRLTAKEGLTGNNVFAVAGSPRSGLWVATDRGLSRFRDGVWTNFPMGTPPGDAVSAMVATDWGVWAGGPHGLGRLRGGKWKGFLPGARVTYLLADLDGNGVWVGTAGEGIHHSRGESFVNYSALKGQRLRAVHNMTFTKSGAVIAAGHGELGHSLSFFDGNYWTSYIPRPAARIRWIQLVNGRVLFSYKDRILVLRRKEGEGHLPVGPVALERKLSPDAPSGYPAPRFYTEPLDRWLPSEATIITGHGSGALIGTRTAGLVQYDGTKTRWYRTRDLVGEKAKLAVACSQGKCYLAGGGVGYVFDGESFERVEVTDDKTARVDAFVNDGSGAVVAVVVPAEGKSVVTTALQGGKWIQQKAYPITIPSGRVAVRFARVSPTGDLWVGLGFREPGGELRPWGVAALAVGGSVVYHRSTLLPTENRGPGSLALPDDARDVEFLSDGTVFLATGSGICRINGNKVKLFTENEGLTSEIIHKVVRSPKGEILVGSHAGLGRFDGKQWRFDFDKESEASLRTPVRALLRDGDTLWVGTGRGLLRSKEGTLSIIDSRHGLADDEVHDIYRDQSGRLWVLTAGGLSILSPGKG